MAIEINLEYNPYLPELNILIEGQQPPQYSRLTQFVDEDIWLWHSEILDVIYREICEEFFIIFTGTELDSYIMKEECRKNSHCTGFSEKRPYVNTPLQKRLGELNQFIKNNKLLNYQRTILDVTIIVPVEFQEYLDDILGIDINNLFCNTRIQISNGKKEYVDDQENSFLFILSKSIEEGEKVVQKYKSGNPIFLICQGEDHQLTEIHDTYLLYESSLKNVIATIFECFLGFPLILALRKCVNSLALNKKQTFGITTINPLTDVEIEKNVEMAKSNVIKITFDPPVYPEPKIIFRVINTEIATTDNMTVFGRKPGKTQLEAYYYGAKKPFYTCDINVIQRNRIKKIILDEDELLLGVGDVRKMHCEYSPLNADNANMIAWKSSDGKVAAVDKKGNLICKSPGICKVICTAENVSAICECEVRPYLESLNVELPDNGVEKQLYLEPMQEYELRIKEYPENSIDSSYKVSSSDYSIANIIGNKIIAKNSGMATIEVVNSSGRKRISFTVKVSKTKLKIFKNLFRK